MDYEVYRLSKKEWLLYGSQGVGYLALLDFVFYRSAALFAVLAILGVVTDPTTAGLSDSDLAMTYEEPRED